MIRSKLRVPALLLMAQACSGGGFQTNVEGVATATAGTQGLDAKAGAPSGAGGSSGGSLVGAGGASASKTGGTSAVAGEAASSGGGGSSSSGTSGGSSGSSGASSATGGSSGSTGTGDCAPGGTTPCVRQALEWAAGDDNGKKGVLTFEQPVLAKSTIVVFAADMNVNRSSPDAPIGSGSPEPITVTDSSNGTYQELLTVLNPFDWDDTKLFVRTNIPAGNLTVEAGWVTNQWHALMVVEVANVSSAPSIAVAGFLNHSVAETKDAATSGPLTLKTSPALVVGLGVNFTDKAGDEGAPFAGTGYSAVLNGWNWKGKEGTTTLPSALLEAAYFANPGKVAATFTPSKTINYKDNVMAIAVGLQ